MATISFLGMNSQSLESIAMAISTHVVECDAYCYYVLE